MRRRTYLAATAAVFSLGGCSDNAKIITPSPDSTSVAPTTSEHDTQAEREPTPTDTPQEEPRQKVTPEGTPSQAPLKIDYDVAQVKQNATVVPYDTLIQNIDEYREEPIYFEYARVYRVAPAGAHTQVQLAVSTTSRDWQGVIGADWNSDGGLIEGDIIQMWGFVRGLYEYETIRGDTRFAPLLQMVDYQLYDGDSTPTPATPSSPTPSYLRPPGS